MSKLVIPILTCFAILGAAFALGLGSPEKDASGSYVLPPGRTLARPHEIVWGEIDAPLPASLPVYALVPDPVDAAEAAALAARLGVEGEVVYDLSKDAFWIEDADGEFHVVAYAVGGHVTYADPDRIFDTIEGPAPLLPPPEEATAAARRFLMAKGLLPDPSQLAGPTFYYNEQGEVNVETGESKVVPTNLQVRWGRLVGGVPAAGPGARLYVHFADGGDIVGVTMRWPTLGPGVPTTLASLEEAKALAASDAARFEGADDCDVFRAESAKLRYFVPELVVGAKAFPVYDFHGTCDGVPADQAAAVISVPAVR